MKKFYQLPPLPYSFKDLEPIISEEQLRIHYEKHHQAYVNGANAILEKLDKGREGNEDLDIKALLKELSFNIGGHLLHSLYWYNLTPPSKAKEIPDGVIKEKLDKEFGSFERFKKEFIKAAQTTEGSGWACLTYCKQTDRPIIMQVEKHNTNVYPMFRILLVCDVFEHAYYLDYKNDRAKYLENFFKIINWEAVNKRLAEILE
ncbi:MAG: superoxide dismutase [candidate division WOR-3 bacterium]|nr:superoxide dismutase [candidate division WOR-3 bacterium]MCX7836966.1 superoxide dismutase [candidate division WOR-3 bacterium]MDW8114094.1 superoxide dismutase [candidate division WOR-3 bacterium]